jgi:TolB-like protein
MAAPLDRPRSRRRLSRVLAGAMTFAIASIAGSLPPLEPIARSSDATAVARVAVMEFGAGSADAAQSALGVGLQSILTTDLSQVSGLVLVERARLQDLTRELKLGRSGLVDPATAAKLGKLAGATHLVTGTYTIAGGKLRLDCRMIEVGTGKVVIASRAEGEQDAFFELEKNLVAQLFGAFEVKPSAKERGAIARNQTGDFEAFRYFSQGLRLFDDKKYDEALSALRSATEKDEDFKLARLTLAEYEKLVSTLRARAKDLETEQALSSDLSGRKAATGEQAVLDKLFGIAAAKGKETAERRALALYLLMRAYKVRSRGDAEHAGEMVDAFARERTADALQTRYHAEAVSLYPAFPPFAGDTMTSPPIAPDSVTTFDEDFARAMQRLTTWGLQTEGRPPRVSSRYRDGLHRYQLGATTNSLEEAARQMHLDRRGEADLLDRIYRLAQKMHPDPEWNEREIRKRAEARRALLDLDASTRLFADLSAHEKDPQTLLFLAHAVETNRQLAQALGEGGPSSLRREFLILELERQSAAPTSNFDAYFKGEELTDRGAYELTSKRALGEKFMLIGDEAVWPRSVSQYDRTLWTGPRSDPLRADEVRFYASRQADARGLIMVGGAPRREVSARADVSFEIPRDFRPGMNDRPELRDRPRLTFVFAATCVTCPPGGHDPNTGEQQWRPMRALGLRISDDRIECGELTLGRRGRGDTPPDFAVKAQVAGGFGGAPRLRRLRNVVRSAAVRMRDGRRLARGTHHGSAGSRETRTSATCLRPCPT